MKKPKPHGGKREGAGRKPDAGQPQITRSVAMVPATWALLDNYRELAARGSYIADLIQEKHTTMKPKEGTRCLIEIAYGRQYLASWRDEYSAWVTEEGNRMYEPSVVFKWWDLSIDAAKSYKP